MVDHPAIAHVRQAAINLLPDIKLILDVFEGSIIRQEINPLLSFAFGCGHKRTSILIISLSPARVNDRSGILTCGY